MSRFLKLVLPVLSLIFFSPESVGICKWIDEDGSVHYAETCPEDSHSTQVEIAPPPTPEQVEAASQRLEQAKIRTNARKQQIEQQKELESLRNKTADGTHGEKVNICAEARWNLSILREQLPVYYDEQNKLHFNRSLHDSWYEGQRRYIDDLQRQQEIERLQKIETQNCTSSEADIRERIRIYMQNDHEDACMSLRNKLEAMREASTGIPSDQMRDLQELISTRCQ